MYTSLKHHVGKYPKISVADGREYFFPPRVKKMHLECSDKKTASKLSRRPYYTMLLIEAQVSLRESILF